MELVTNKIAIITPCFNENLTVIAFLKELNQIVSSLPFHFTLVVVDDASTDDTLEMLQAFQPIASNVDLQILTLKFNSGHQGAIYQGMLFARNLPCKKFIIMDSDGEDDPAAIKELVYLENLKIVNVVRGKREESLLFRLSYQIYKLFFNVITGRRMNFGNYCMIDKGILTSASYTSFVHLAAYLSKQRVETAKLVYNRRKRLDGSSKMNLTSLVHHAFKSFIEYAEDFLMMFLKLFILIALAIAGLISIILYKKFISHEAILGWASNLSVGLFNTALICLGFFIIGILLLNISAKTRITNAENYINVSKQESN